VIRVETLKVKLPLKKRFTVSKGSADSKTNILVILNNRYSGEAATSVYYGPTIQQLESDLRTGARFLEQQGQIDVATLDQLSKLTIHPIARSALIGMVLNYLSGESGRYPWEILSLATPVGIKSSSTVALDDPDAMIKAIKESEYPIVKVKLGTTNDTKVIDAFSAITDKEIRVDANGGWSCAQAEEMIYHLARSGVRIIEQPTECKNVADWPHLKGKHTDVVLLIDEGVGTIEDYEQVSKFVDGVNIKMEKSGGILEAINIATKAHEDQKKVMLGCMVESSIGIAQSVYMSSLADYIDLDGPQLLQDDIGRGIKYNREQIEVDREIIGGPTLIRDVIDKYTSE
jgi:L-alanine-DL-glutamate epimerase-like enolase superfamily enzyme